MNIVTFIRNTIDKTVYIEWETRVENIKHFQVYLTNNENSVLVSNTSLSFFTDYLNFNPIESSDMSYLIQAIDNNNDVIDSCRTESYTSLSRSQRASINILKYKAQIAFSNTQWAEKAYVIKQKVAGTKCSCFTDDFNASNDPGCPKCYGTGIVGGYMPLIPTFVIPLSAQVMDSGINAQLPTRKEYAQLAMPSYPAIKPGDHILLVNTGIYEVTRSTYSAVGRQRTATQMVEASLLSGDNKIYEVNFTSSMNTEIHSIEYSPKNKELIINGKNLVPYIGKFKIRVEDPSGKHYHTFYGVDIKKRKHGAVSPTKIILNIPDSITVYSTAFISLNMEHFKNIKVTLLQEEE